MATPSGVYTVDDIVHLVKVDMGLSDTDYTSSQYKSLVDKSLIRLNRRISTALVASGSTTVQAIISPNPTDTILDLIILQTECLVAQNQRRQAISKGIKVRDGDSSIDTTSSFGGHAQVVKDYCDEIDEAILDYIRDVNGANINGKLITYGNSNVIESVDHNGDSSGERDWTSPFDNSR
jgi:hypothetical protein